MGPKRSPAERRGRRASHPARRARRWRPLPRDRRHRGALGRYSHGTAGSGRDGSRASGRAWDSPAGSARHRDGERSLPGSRARPERPPTSRHACRIRALDNI